MKIVPKPQFGFAAKGLAIAIVAMSFGAAKCNGQYSVNWYTFCSGGGFAAGGAFDVEGSIGQGLAGAVMSGNSYTVTSGFMAFLNPPTQPVVDVPDSYNVFRGIELEGSLGHFLSSDNLRARFSPGFTLSSSEAPVWLSFETVVTNSTPTLQTISCEARANTPGLTATTEMWNWNSSSWQTVDVTSESFNSDSINEVDVSSGASNFVASNGQSRMRIGWRKTGITILFPWEIGVDHVTWTAE